MSLSQLCPNRDTKAREASRGEGNAISTHLQPYTLSFPQRYDEQTSLALHYSADVFLEDGAPPALVHRPGRLKQGLADNAGAGHPYYAEKGACRGSRSLHRSDSTGRAGFMGRGVLPYWVNPNKGTGQACCFGVLGKAFALGGRRRSGRTTGIVILGTTRRGGSNAAQLPSLPALARTFPSARSRSSSRHGAGGSPRLPPRTRTSPSP